LAIAVTLGTPTAAVVRSSAAAIPVRTRERKLLLFEDPRIVIAFSSALTNG
jgi:hypothetical protein